MQNDDGRRLSLFYLTTLALALGLVTGLGAFLFRDLIGLLHNIFFTGRFMVPNRDFTIVGEDVVAYDVIDKMWHESMRSWRSSCADTECGAPKTFWASSPRSTLQTRSRAA
jgi:hypothetical protein